MRSPALRYLVRVSKLAAIGVFLIAGTHFFIIQPSEVNGRSMEPTFYDEEIIFIDKFSLLFRKPRRGDIVTVIRDENPDKIVKRIIGLPGEKVRIENGGVLITTVEGETFALDEPYLAEQYKTYPPGENSRTYRTIPENQYFILGDNRQYSIDSRYHGPIHRNEIVGIIRWGR